jgi:hypothetical protein
VVLGAVAWLVACGDGAKRRPLGGSCGFDEDCSSGLCFDSVCLDPDADEDVDGLTNGVELSLGTNPSAADTDGDGKADPDELGPGLSGVDTDGDGLIDAVESATADSDKDCIVDELDAHNAVSDGDKSPDVAEVCPAVGVCADAKAVLAVTCPTRTDQPVCDFGRVPFHEPVESACDLADNDCDGETDEGCEVGFDGLIGHWQLDGDGNDTGPYRDHGVVTGAVSAADRFGAAGKALRFANVGDRVTVTATHHPLGEATVSYTVWVKPERDARVDQAVGLFSFGEIAENRRSGLVLGAGSNAERCAGYIGQGNDGASESACVPAGHWSLLAVVKEGRRVRFYLDAKPAGEVELAAGQSLRRTSLTIGASKQFASGVVLEPFVGVLDDLRVYRRAIDAAELGRLVSEGTWGAAGTGGNPAQSCLHALRAGRGVGADSDGAVVVDSDGDGPRAAMTVWCDQTTDGGGWTLAWVYGFTDFAAFTAAGNAVTPIPAWPVTSADVAVSRVAPGGPSSSGAIDWAEWEDLGTSFLVTSELAGGFACDSRGVEDGSLATGLEGPVSCRVVGAGAGCAGALPDWVFFWDYGPGLSAENLFFYFDGSTVDNWPTHDACGLNAAPTVTAPTRAGGAVYLR